MKDLEIDYNRAEDTVTIEGITYAGELFRGFGGWIPLNVPFEIMKRENGVVTVHDLREYTAP